MKQLNLAKNGEQGSLTIKNQTDTSADLLIFGTIADTKWCDDDVIPKDVKTLLDEIKDVKTLNIYINSGGGSVFAGMAIYNMLKRFKAQKNVYVEGLAASAASVIAMVGDTLVIPANAFLMVHKAWTWTIGNMDDMLKSAEVLETIDIGMLAVYEENLNAGVSIADFKTLVDAETWLTGEQAAEYFDVTVAPATEAAAYTGPLNYQNIPKGLKREAPNGKKQKQALARLKAQADL